MAHIHERIDFTVAIFVVHAAKVLVIHHRKLDAWLPLGGHVELDEDPEAAALREAREESGLEVELLGERPPTTGPGTRALIAPRFLDIHRITDTHEHIGMIYWARPKAGSVVLAGEEHRAIRWCSAAELETLEPPMSGAVKWYCRQAIAEVSAGTAESGPGFQRVPWAGQRSPSPHPSPPGEGEPPGAAFRSVVSAIVCGHFFIPC
jgi:8-oxo-dGTP pyrophosphatase MutT (NUDIX family)